MLRTAQGINPQAVQRSRGLVWEGLSHIKRPQSKVNRTLEVESLRQEVG
jgi:hypothetical protein